MKGWIVILIMAIAVAGGVLVYNQYMSSNTGTTITTTAEHSETTSTSTSPYTYTTSSTTQTTTSSKYLADSGWNTGYLSCSGACDTFKVLAWKVVYEKTNINPPHPWIVARFFIKISLKEPGCAEFYNPKGKELYHNYDLDKGVHIITMRSWTGQNTTIISGDYKLVLYDFPEKKKAVWIIHVVSDKIYIDKAVIKIKDFGEKADFRYRVTELKAVIRNEGNVPNFFYIVLEVEGYHAYENNAIIEPGTTKEFTWGYSEAYWLPVDKPGVYNATLIVYNGFAGNTYKIKVTVPENSEHTETYVFKS